MQQHKLLITISRPYFDPADCDADCDAVLDDTLAKFGYEGFRPGQREAIKRILRCVCSRAVKELETDRYLFLPKYSAEYLTEYSAKTE